MGIFVGGSGHGPESSFQISAYYKFFPGLYVFCRISTGVIWSRGNAFAFGAGHLRFKSRASQIGQSVANDSPPVQHFLEWSCVARRRNDAEMGPANLLHALA